VVAVLSLFNLQARAMISRPVTLYPTLFATLVYVFRVELPVFPFCSRNELSSSNRKSQDVFSDFDLAM
jgi:hypothetical protein